MCKNWIVKRQERYPVTRRFYSFHCFMVQNCWITWQSWKVRIIVQTARRNLDIWLAMHHSTTSLLLPTWYTNFLFIHTNYIKLNSSTCFERNPLTIRWSTTQIVRMQPLVSSLSASDHLVQPRLHKTVTCREWRYQRLHTYNLRRWPPDDKRIALETCRGI